MKHLKKLLMALLCLLFCASLVSAQTVSFTNLPPNKPNDRFYTDHYMKFRPGLSVRGFDSSTLGDIESYLDPGQGRSYGLGLKQILERVYNDSGHEKLGEIFQKIIDLSEESIEAPSYASGVDNKARASAITRNASRFQAKAFIALVTYVLQNELRTASGHFDFQRYDALNPALPRFSVAMFRLTNTGFFNAPCDEYYGDNCSDDRWFPSALSPIYPDGFPLHTDYNDNDRVKWTHAAGALARGLDFYLALENAYEHYGETIFGLLSATKKNKVFTNYWYRTADAIAEYLDSEVQEEALALWYLPDEIGATDWTGVQYDEVEPGNRPLKMHIANGIVAMSMQDMVSFNTVKRHYNEAMTAMYGQAAHNNRKQYWGYQTSGYDSFFAEGAFYMNYALIDVLPFMHAIRSQQLKRFHDPYREDMLVNPLTWLADQTNSKGFFLPLDDGNFNRVYTSNMMRWDDTYGDATLGAKFAWINDKTGILGTDVVLPVAMSVPLNEDAPLAPADQVGTDTPQNHHFLLSRHKAGNNNYTLAMNTEHGDAIERGEGHEQGDPLQLLFHVNGESYLMDTGYDNGSIAGNSSWNHYYDHNVMTGWPDDDHEKNDGGVYAPELDIELLIPHKVIKQPGVTDIAFDVEGNVDILSGQVRLWYEEPGWFLDSDGRAIYKRTTLFIKDPETPYLLDFNRVYTSHMYGGDDQIRYEMNYHIPTSLAKSSFRQGNKYVRFEGLHSSRVNDDNVLWISPFLIENDYKPQYLVSERTVQERSSAEISTKYSIRHKGYPTPETYTDHHSTVAYIRPLPDAQPWEAFGEELNDEMFIQRSSAPVSGNRKWAWFSNTKYTSIAIGAPIEQIDVFVARSASVYRNPSERAVATLMVPEANNVVLTMPFDDDYAFARLIPAGDTWIIDPDYKVNMLITQTVSAPTNLTIQTVPGVGGGGPGGGGPGGPGGGTGGSENPKLIWTASTTPGVTKYIIQRRNAGSSWENWGEVNGDKTEYIDRALFVNSGMMNQNWFYRVQAKKTTAGNTLLSGYSNQASVYGMGLESVEDDSTLTEDVAINEEAAIALPETFSLERNFPNPFSQSTRIVYALPEPSTVKITVYDIMGRVVKVFNQGIMAGGWHDVVWQPEAVGSGMYFYRIEAIGESGIVFTKTHKMVVVR